MNRIAFSVVFVGLGVATGLLVSSGLAEPTDSQLPKRGPLPLTAPFDAEKAKTAQESWAKSLGKSSPVRKNSIGMELVLIPPGRFTMGSRVAETDRKGNESQVDVTLTKAFYLGKTEVTQGQWQAVMETKPWENKEGVVGVKEGVKAGDTYPATYVSWDDAQTFCEKLSEKENGEYRLPTEAEWEYACRAGTTTRFSFGDDDRSLSDYAWWDLFSDNGGTKDEKYAREVGRKKANPFELHDMHGNVFEWCEDWYVDKLPGGTDPVASTGERWHRVYRGGNWNRDASLCRSALRSWSSSNFQRCRVGFRVVRNPGQ